jgi:starvation-inducible DNA-binding protein
MRYGPQGRLTTPEDPMSHLSETIDANPSLGTHERNEIGRLLQGQLVDLIDLSLLGKQAHWNLAGPNFRSLHLQLDEFIEQWRDLSDEVAERAVALGIAPDGQAAAVAAQSEIDGLPAAQISDSDVVLGFAHRISSAVYRARERMDRLEELDLASQDLLIEVVRVLEKQLWMFRVQG